MSNQKKEILQAGQVINILYKYEQGKGAFINIKSPTSKEELEERLFLLDIISNYLPSLKNDLLFTHQIAKILSNLFEEYIFIVDSYKQKIPVIQIDYYEICENCTIRNNFNEIDLFNRHGKEKIPIEILKCRNKEKSSKI